MRLNHRPLEHPDMTPLNTRARSFLSKKLSLALTSTVAASLIFFPLSGCQTANNSPSNSVASTSGLVTANSFVSVASTDVTPDRMPVEAVHLVGDSVYVYVRGPEGTRVMNLSRGLDVRWARVVGSEDDKVRAPVRIGSRVIFPTSVAIEIFDSRGNIERKQKLPLPITTNVSATSRGMLLAGVASPTGGRVAFIDPTLTILPIVRDALLGDITSRPVEFQDTAYAATVSGKVYAIGENNRAVWPLKDGAFLTDSTISSELVVDDFGLYVAAGDSKLYVIDRISGKIKWRYFAQQHLVATPFVTADRVYQITSDSTLVALDKIEGDPYRNPSGCSAVSGRSSVLTTATSTSSPARPRHLSFKPSISPRAKFAFLHSEPTSLHSPPTSPTRLSTLSRNPATCSRFARSSPVPRPGLWSCWISN